MKRVTFHGTGQLNGPKSLNMVLELDDSTARDLMGPSREKVVLALMAVHFPGVVVNPRNVGMNIVEIKEKRNTNTIKSIPRKIQNTHKTKSSFSLFNLFLWVFFFPFKLAWWLLKKVWKQSHI